MKQGKLVLTRKIGDKIEIEGGIVIEITGMSMGNMRLANGTVKLLITAPITTGVHRSEVPASARRPSPQPEPSTT